MKYKHTIFTPVYNRAYMIDDVYDSICKLDYPKQDFEWLIIDDGSTDDLQMHLDRFVKENHINMRCIHKSNGGIHTAMNTAILKAEGEYVTRIDSDDLILPQALKDMDKFILAPKSFPEEKFIGVVGCCINRSDGRIRGTEFPFDVEDGSGHEIKMKYHASGDRNFCMKTGIMRKFPIPEYTDVKWVPEGIIWNRIDLAGYITRFVSTAFSMTSEHAQDSMLDSMSNKKDNRSMLIRYYNSYHCLTETPMWLSSKEKIRYLAIYLAFGKITKKHNKKRDAIKKITKIKKIYWIAAIPASVYLEHKYK